MRTLLLLAVLLAAAPTGHPTVATKLSPRPRLTVGDRFDLTFVVTSPHGSLVTGPLADTTGVFALAGEQRKTKLGKVTDESTYRLSLAGFEPGRHRLPEFRFLVQAAGHTDTLRSDSVAVTIASVLPDSMKDIHGLASAETFPNMLLRLGLVALALLALLAYFGRRLLRRLRRHQELARAPLPPWDEALQALDGLAWREWLEAGESKRYYYALSLILKRYIERRFEFHAAEQTTTEVLASMRANKTPMRDDVARFFNRTDLVKYATRVPTLAEAESAIDEVRAFVHKTKPAEPAPAVPAGAASVAPAAGSA